MELSDSPTLSHRPQLCQPEPVTRVLSPWYLQHRDRGWDEDQGRAASMASVLPSS